MEEDGGADGYVATPGAPDLKGLQSQFKDQVKALSAFAVRERDGDDQCLDDANIALHTPLKPTPTHLYAQQNTAC